MFHMVVSPEKILTVPDTYESSVGYGPTPPMETRLMAVQFHQGKVPRKHRLPISTGHARGNGQHLPRLRQRLQSRIGNHQNPK